VRKLLTATSKASRLRVSYNRTSVRSTRSYLFVARRSCANARPAPLVFRVQHGDARETAAGTGAGVPITAGALLEAALHMVVSLTRRISQVAAPRGQTLSFKNGYALNDPPVLSVSGVGLSREGSAAAAPQVLDQAPCAAARQTSEPAASNQPSWLVNDKKACAGRRPGGSVGAVKRASPVDLTARCPGAALLRFFRGDGAGGVHRPRARGLRRQRALPRAQVRGT
jgi:hypothetical protein